MSVDVFSGFVGRVSLDGHRITLRGADGSVRTFDVESGPCPGHAADTGLPVRFYMDAEPCYGCHPELASASPGSRAYQVGVDQARGAWRTRLTQIIRH